jgi:hypothetical protein
MRMPGTRASRRAHACALVVLVCLGAGVSAAAPGELGSGGADPALAATKKQAKKKHRKTPARAKSPAFIRKAQARGSSVPFWLRLRSPSDTAPNDDRIELTWDDAVDAWPVAGSVPEPTVSTAVDGSLTYELDFGAETSGYGALGTVETRVGARTSLTGGGFPIAAFPDNDPEQPCAGPRLVATGISLQAAEMRFGTVNLLQGTASGTISVRAAVRTQRRTCDGQLDGPSMLAPAADSDPPIPLPFDGAFKLSPAITADGRIRFGVLRVSAATTRSAFARLYACTDPTGDQGCGRAGLPMRARWSSLRAEVMLGQNAPPAAPAP